MIKIKTALLLQKESKRAVRISSITHLSAVLRSINPAAISTWKQNFKHHSKKSTAQRELLQIRSIHPIFYCKGDWTVTDLAHRGCGASTHGDSKNPTCTARSSLQQEPLSVCTYTYGVSAELHSDACDMRHSTTTHSCSFCSLLSSFETTSSSKFNFSRIRGFQKANS